MSIDRNEIKRCVQSDMKETTASQNHIQNTIADPSNDRMSSSILKLDVDCFEELFDWLPLTDLLSLRQTCKRLKKVVDYFINTNYPAVEMGCGSIRLWSQKDYNRLQELDVAKAAMIKYAGIDFDLVTEKEIDTVKRILPQLERLETWQFKGAFNKSILEYCSNLKCLQIYQYSCVGILTEENGWLHRPTIEHFEIGGFNTSINMSGLNKFFELNANIQTFSISHDILRENCNDFLQSNIKIDQLNVYGSHLELADLINQLYKRGFYKRLHWYVYGKSSREHLDRVLSVCALEKLGLSFYAPVRQVILKPKPELKEFCFGDIYRDLRFDFVAKCLENIERIYFWEVVSDQLIPFIRYAPKVKEIKVRELREGTHFEEGVIDLSALNKARRGLAGAKKITLYVHEDIFLSTKFMSAKTEFSLITLKRAAAVQWTYQPY